MELVDIPLVGRSFTWFRPNGKAKSRIDRVLISRKWLDSWQGCTQYVLNRNAWDHCPILVKNNSFDWGPRSFKIFNCWFQDKRLHELEKKVWSDHKVEG